MPYRNLILAVLLSWLSALTFASDEGEFLPVNQAFQVTAETAGNHIHFRFTVAEGYYLYKPTVHGWLQREGQFVEQEGFRCAGGG